MCSLQLAGSQFEGQLLFLFSSIPASAWTTKWLKVEGTTARSKPFSRLQEEHLDDIMASSFRQALQAAINAACFEQSPAHAHFFAVDRQLEVRSPLQGGYEIHLAYASRTAAPALYPTWLMHFFFTSGLDKSFVGICWYA